VNFADHSTKTVTFVAALAALSGCSGTIEHVRPETPRSPANAKIIDQPRAAVWDESIPLLGKQFFVINNLDKLSGLANISFSRVDPERYVDCGRATSVVWGPLKRTYEFPGSKADVTYYAGTGLKIAEVHQQMNLDGRANLVFEQLDPSRTRVTVNVQYVLQRSLTPLVMDSSADTDTISMTGTDRASFPDGMECIPTGLLERDILATIK
jgi:hypothetical protein